MLKDLLKEIQRIEESVLHAGIEVDRINNYIKDKDARIAQLEAKIEELESEVQCE